MALVKTNPKQEPIKIFNYTMVFLLIMMRYAFALWKACTPNCGGPRIFARLLFIMILYSTK